MSLVSLINNVVAKSVKVVVSKEAADIYKEGSKALGASSLVLGKETIKLGVSTVDTVAAAMPAVTNTLSGATTELLNVESLEEFNRLWNSKNEEERNLGYQELGIKGIRKLRKALEDED